MNAARPNWTWQIQEGGHQTGNTHVLPSKHDKDEIPIPTQMFTESSNTERLVRIQPDIWIRRK